MTSTELTVATALDVIVDASDTPGVHRTTLQALLWAAKERAELAEALPAIPDQRGVSDALLNLRAQHLVVLGKDGFHLTAGGESAVEQAGTSDEELTAFREELARLVGLKMTEWQLSL